MKIEKFNWDVAYEKVTDFLRNIHAHDFYKRGWNACLDEILK